MIRNTNNATGQVEDIYEVSDNETNNLGEQHEEARDEEVVGEEARANDEPYIIMSHTDTREYAAHMRAREALPDNHDDIFANLPEENNGRIIAYLYYNFMTDELLDQDNMDPFETDIDVVNNQPNGVYQTSY